MRWIARWALARLLVRLLGRMSGGALVAVCRSGKAWSIVSGLSDEQAGELVARAAEMARENTKNARDTEPWAFFR